MKKRLVQHGDDLALIITKPMLKKLGIDKEAALEIKIDDKKMIIAEAGKKKEESIEEIGIRIMDKYSSVFKKLAE